MKGVPTGFWGKLEVEGDAVLGWHPLAHHCADVAACAEALLRQTLLRRRLARLAGRDELDPVTRPGAEDSATLRVFNHAV
ncbi:MAG: hypothetical protein JNK72_09075 [Myxococcales bacterium]|nr:hypothetical protein [Myxococcales bacterium]